MPGPQAEIGGRSYLRSNEYVQYKVCGDICTTV